MQEPFDLPVTYKGEELLFPAHLQQSGYTHRIVVDVYGTIVFYEPDEERHYRALVEEEKNSGQINTELLKAIGEAIESLLQ